MAGCTTEHALTRTQLDQLASAIQVGDTLRVTMSGDVMEKIRVTAIGPDALQGIASGGSEVMLPLADIRSAKYRKLAPAKTAGLVVGIVTLLGIHNSCKPHDEFGTPACVD